MKIGDPCIDAKARFRMIFFMNGSAEQREKIFKALPYDFCRSPEEGSLLLREIKECTNRQGKADRECWNLVTIFRITHCLTPKVEKVLRKRSDSPDGELWE